MTPRISRRAVLGAPLLTMTARAADFRVEIERLTSGPKNHFFGYIGHVRNTPWNGDDRYLVLLRTGFQDRMPGLADPADVVLVDTRRGNAVVPVEQCRAWNPQQGTMFYWNPAAPRNELIFNDRDPKTNRVFAVLFDIEKRKRIREYRFDDTPAGNSGVAQKGGRFLALNYGRMARLRRVTGYPEAYDWTVGVAAPENDGIFIVEIATGRKRLLVSFRQLAELAAARGLNVAGKHFFINHTLWNRDDDRIYFYLRADFDSRERRIDLPCTIRPDGSGLKAHQHVGGHPEWEFGPRVIGSKDKRQVLYDVDAGEIVGSIGDSEILPQPEGDSALSHDGRWFVNGYRVGKENLYVVLRRSDSAYVRTRGLPIDNWTGGDLRCDPAPCWNRANNTIAVPAIADDATRSRQTFLLRVVAGSAGGGS